MCSSDFQEPPNISVNSKLSCEKTWPNATVFCQQKFLSIISFYNYIVSTVQHTVFYHRYNWMFPNGYANGSNHWICMYVQQKTEKIYKFSYPTVGWYWWDLVGESTDGESKHLYISWRFDSQSLSYVDSPPKSVQTNSNQVKICAIFFLFFFWWTNNW